MTTLITHSVVDRMVAQLAERRRASIGRRAAYLALAQAIVSDEQADRLVSPTLEAIGSQVAA
jgi:hypothetical protein